MDRTQHLFVSFVASQKASHAGRLRVAAVLSLLLAALLWQTQWPTLRPGILVLLAGQAGLLIALALRNRRLTQVARINTLPIDGSVDAEAVFLRHLAWFENLSQAAGFALLGWGFRVATGSLWTSLAIGVLYPAAMYFGIARTRQRQRLREVAVRGQQLLEARCI